MSDIGTVKGKIGAIMVARHYGPDTATILMRGPITLHLEAEGKPKDGTGAEVDASALTQEDVNVIAQEADSLCDWIAREVKEFCGGMAMVVNIISITEKSVTFSVQASPEYRC